MPALSLRLRTTCTACGQPIPMSSAALDLVCPACETPKRLKYEDFSWLMAGSIAALKGTAPSPPQETPAVVLGEVSGSDIKCRCCQRTMTARRLEPAPSQGAVLCRCGHEIPCRLVPRELDPDRWWSAFVGESDGAEPSPANAQADFPCPHCGALRVVDGSSRTSSCSYCGTRSVIPDELWRALRPTPKAQPFYLWVDDTWYQQHLRLKGRQAKAVTLAVFLTLGGVAAGFAATAFIPGMENFVLRGDVPATWQERAWISFVASWMIAWAVGAIVARRSRPRRPSVLVTPAAAP